MSTVWFMVDDTDPRLNYTGSWSFMPLSEQAAVSFTGPAYNNTLHESSDNSTVSFRFNGSSRVVVYGTINAVFMGATINPALIPNISCWLDGATIQNFNQVSGVIVNLLGSQNNLLSCFNNVKSSNSEEHELLIRTSIPSGSVGWLIDYIVFESVVDPDLDGEILQAGNGQIQSATNYSMPTFGPGWTQYDILGAEVFSSATSITHSSAAMKFNGTSLSLYGGLNSSDVGTTATYQVDDSASVVFSLSGVPLFAGPGFFETQIWYNQPLFNISDLKAGEHTVVVALGNTSTGASLAINYFYVTSLTASEQESLGVPELTATQTHQTSTSTPTPTHMIINHHTNHTTPAILGAVLPTLLLVVITILWYKRKLRHQRELRLSAASPFKHSDLITTPFNYEDFAVRDNIAQEKILLSSTTPLVMPNSNQNDTQMDQPNPMNVPYMKLQQRLVILEEQAQQREQHLADSVTPQQQPQQLILPVVHTDSGLRLNGEVLEVDHEMEEVPPGYTAD